MNWKTGNSSTVFAVICVLTVLAAYFPQWVSDAGWIPKLLLLSCASFGLVITNFKKPVQPAFSVSLCLLGIVVIAVIPGMFISTNPGDAILTWMRLWLLLLLTLTLVFLVELEVLKKGAIKSSIILLAAFSIWGLLEWFFALEGGHITHKATYLVSTSLGHRNVFIQFLILLMPLALNGLRFSKTWRLISIFALGCATFLAVFLLNRSAWFGIAIIAIGVGIWEYRNRELTKRLDRSVWKILLLALIGMLLMLLLIVDEPYTLWHHVEMTLNTQSGTTRDRLLLIQRSIDLFVQAPLTGIGLGMWKIEIMGYPQAGMLTENALVFYQRPHNDYLWLFSEAGFVAGLLYLSIHLLGIFRSIKIYMKDQSLFNLSILLCWLLFILASITLFPLERGPYLLVLALLIALQIPRLKTNSSSAYFLKTGMLILSVGLVLGFSLRLIKEIHLKNGFDARSKGDWVKLEREMKATESHWLTIDQFSAPIRYHIAIAQYQQGEKAEAEQSLKEASALNPYHPEVWNNLGMIQAQKGKLDSALTCFRSAVKYTSSYQEAWINIAAIQYQQGEWRSAFSSYLKADSTDLSVLYSELGKRLAVDSLNHLLPRIEDRKMLKTLEAIRNTPSWALEIITKCAANDLPFEYQAYLDACYYMLKNCEHFEDCDVVDTIIDKYLPNGIEDLNLEEENTN